MKISKKNRRDYDFYVANKRFTFTGTAAKVFPLAEDGRTAIECFVSMENTGKLLPCCEPELLSAVLQTKGAINHQIKQWAEGQLDMLEPIEELLKSFIDPPKWVEKSLCNGIRKYCINNPKRFKEFVIFYGKVMNDINERTN